MTEIKDVPIESIQYLKDVYPRESWDQETVNRYRQAIDRLPPIQVTHEHILIDGYHRLMAHRIAQRETIRARIEQIERDDVLWEATRRNATHGLQLSMKDKKQLARSFFEKGRKQSEIAAVLSVSVGSVNKWVRQLKVAQDNERDDQILQMWLACRPYDEIAQATGFADKSGPAKVIERLKKFKNEDFQPPNSLKVYNLWNFPNNDKRYGVDYPGRIPGQIVENVLYYYTEPFDFVVDPMAGGGTTLDVCKAMSRRCRCYDIKPVRDDIVQHDITTGFPAECRGCDLIFLDPPYWSQKHGEYSDDETNLANLPLDEFYAAMDAVFFSAADILAKDGHIAVIVGPTQLKGEIFDHAHEFEKSLERHGFRFANRIIVPYSTQQAQAYHVTAAKDGRFMLKLYRDLLIYRRGG